jgi:TolA-binding protein
MYRSFMTLYFCGLLAVTGATSVNINGRVVNGAGAGLPNVALTLAVEGSSTVSAANGAFQFAKNLGTTLPGHAVSKTGINLRTAGTTIIFDLSPTDLPAEIVVRSLSGRVVERLKLAANPQGIAVYQPKGADGIYLLQLKLTNANVTLRLTLAGGRPFTQHVVISQALSPQISNRSAKTVAIVDTLVISAVNYAIRRIPLSSYTVTLDTIILAAVAVDPATPADTLFKRGSANFAVSAWDSAAAYFAEYITRFPQGPSIADAHYFHARSIFELGNMATAGVELTAFVNGYPVSPRIDWAQYYLGQSWYAAAQYDSARVRFSLVSTLYADSLSADDALYYLGRCDYELKAYIQARAEFRNLRTRFAASPYLDGAWFYEGASLYGTAVYDTAALMMKEFPVKYPLSPFTDNAAYYLGKCSYQLASYSQAIAQFTSFLSTYPSSQYAPNARLGIADSYYAQGITDSTNYQKALTEYLACFNAWPAATTTASAIEGAGECYYYLADYANARTWLNKIEAVYPQSVNLPASYYFLGRCDMAELLYSAAIPWFNKVITLFPANTKTDNALYQRGRCNYHLQAFPAALADFDAYRTQYPTGAYNDNTYYYTVRIYVAQGNCASAKSELAAMTTKYPTSTVLASTQTACQTKCP